mmetsp:Transcript_3487/g.4785  ORF Transcript_3487/g.4785 Transcript_3487/m.4785 type:complete len:141 (+) Transcript_3487:305-727(+)
MKHDAMRALSPRGTKSKQVVETITCRRRGPHVSRRRTSVFCVAQSRWFVFRVDLQLTLVEVLVFDGTAAKLSSCPKHQPLQATHNKLQGASNTHHSSFLLSVSNVMKKTPRNQGPRTPKHGESQFTSLQVNNTCVDVYRQ